MAASMSFARKLRGDCLIPPDHTQRDGTYARYRDMLEPLEYENLGGLRVVGTQLLMTGRRSRSRSDAGRIDTVHFGGTKL